nr:hypothetical protein [Tanacetum cinerariifolium]
GMSIEINKKKELRQLEQATNLSTNSTKPTRRFNSFYDDDDDYEESTIHLNKIISQIPPSIVITSSLLVLPTEDSEDSLITRDEDLSTIPKKESDESDSECDLPSCDDLSPINVLEGNFVTFSNPLFDSNDDFTSGDGESLSNEDVPEDKVKIYSNSLFEFDDEYISRDVNPLFDEVLENIENNDLYDSNFDEPDLPVTPFLDTNEDECFDPGGDIDKIDAFLEIDISMDIKDGYFDSEG